MWKIFSCVNCVCVCVHQTSGRLAASLRSYSRQSPSFTVARRTSRPVTPSITTSWTEYSASWVSLQVPLWFFVMCTKSWDALYVQRAPCLTQTGGSDVCFHRQGLGGHQEDAWVPDAAEGLQEDNVSERYDDQTATRNLIDQFNCFFYCCFFFIFKQICKQQLNQIHGEA